MALIEEAHLNQRQRFDLTRRAFLRMSLVLPASLALGACAGGAPSSITRGTSFAARRLELTPTCDEESQVTLAQTAGPFFTPNSPERRSLMEPDLIGTPVALTGYVLSEWCEPIPGALLDFWQADDAGAYDNIGYRLRGHQFADEGGRYELQTIVPGLYPGRTRHFHVRVQPPSGSILTTQLYFPDEPRNRTDGIFNPALVIGVEDTDDGKGATFNFVVKT